MRSTLRFIVRAGRVGFTNTICDGALSITNMSRCCWKHKVILEVARRISILAGRHSGKTRLSVAALVFASPEARAEHMLFFDDMKPGQYRFSVQLCEIEGMHEIWLTQMGQHYGFLLDGVSGSSKALVRSATALTRLRSAGIMAPGEWTVRTSASSPLTRRHSFFTDSRGRRNLMKRNHHSQEADGGA